MDRSVVIDQEVRDPNWLAGFTSGEGCFLINLINNSAKKRVQVQLVMWIGQHVRDKALMSNLISYFDCGRIEIKNNSKFNTWVVFTVTKFTDINDKIITFFRKYPVLGVKSQDFDDWCKVAELIKEKKHLTDEGLDQIRKIKAGMNKGRTV
jgi:hypothetical protein